MTDFDEEIAEYTVAAPPTAAREARVPTGCAGLRLDQALARVFTEYSRTQLRTWVDEGRIRVDGALSAATRRLRGGEHILLAGALPDRVTQDQPEDIPLAVVFEDDDLLVVDKPAGLVVHPGAGNQTGTLLNALLAHAPCVRNLPRCGIVHRIDKDTSGLLMIAKTLEAQTALVRQLQARTVSRRYQAIAHGRLLQAGTVDAAIGRHPTQRTRMAVTERGKPARTHYRPLRSGNAWTLLECSLETGRTHQIRVHMQHVGHPLLGDPVYGPRSAPPSIREPLAGFARQALHAFSLSLEHPASGAQLTWTSPLPRDFATLLSALERS